MQRSIINRLEKVEAEYRHDPLIVLAVDEDGNNIEMPLREMIDKGYGFAKCVRGGTPGGEDIQTLLDYMAFWNGLYQPDRFFTKEFQDKGRKILEEDPNAEEKRRAEIDRELEEYQERINKHE